MTHSPSPLCVNESQLRSHFDGMTTVVKDALEKPTDARIDPDWSAPLIVAGLVGADCEHIYRNRGGQVHVVPFCDLTENLVAWLSYREEWRDEQLGRKGRFSFRSSNLSIYFGRKHDTYKPQMFRAEWAGWAQWSGGSYSFQGGDAGHPHWQVDAIESLQGDKLEQRASNLSRLLSETDAQSRQIVDFADPEPNHQTKSIIASQNFSRLHLPSAAAWWKSPPHDVHTHSPRTTADVQIWVGRSLRYVRSELQRLRSI